MVAPQLIESIAGYTLARARCYDVLGAGGRAFKSPRPDQTLYLQYVKRNARALFGTAHMSQVQWTANPPLKNKDFYRGEPLRIGIFLLLHLYFRLQSGLFSPI